MGEIIFIIVFAVLVTLVGFLKAREEVHPGLSAERYAELNAQLIDEEGMREQVRQGNKIKAIKMYREQTGVGLKEAKEAVERMMEGGPKGYEQGYQAPPETHQEGEQHHPYPQQDASYQHYEQPHAQYPEQMPPMDSPVK